MRQLAALVVLVPSLAFAGGRDVSEPENLPPPKQPAEVEPAPTGTTATSDLGSYRKSVTLEASVGLGYLASGVNGVDGGLGLSGINFGVGGFLNNKLAITGRVFFLMSRGSSPTSLVLVSGAVQYWLNDKLWLGAGAGLSYAYVEGSNDNGFGLDARAGYTFKQTRQHAWNASVEVVPAFFDGTLFGVAALVGYQYL